MVENASGGPETAIAGKGFISGRVPGSLAWIGAVLVLVGPGVLRAQSLTHSVNPSGFSGVRAVGIGDAFVGLADDSSCILLNPAGLSTVPRSLEGLAAYSGDGPWGLSAGLRPGRWYALGLQVSNPAASEVWAIQTARVPDASPVSYAHRTDYAVGGALFIGTQNEFSVGGSVRWSHLSLGDATDSSDGTLSFVAGLLFRPVNHWAPRIGISYRHRLDWRMETPEVSRRLRAPAVISTGVSWYYEPERRLRLLFTLQPDLVLHSELTPGEDGPEAARNDVDFRSGLEMTFPWGRWTGCGSMLQARLSLSNWAAVPFAARSIARGEWVGQGAGRTTSWSAGLALALRQVLHGRLKLEVAWDDRTETLAFGVGYRFPEAFRAEIVDATRR